MSREHGKTAHEVASEMLEITGSAMLEGDFDTFSSFFHLPHFISSADNKAVLTTLDDLRGVFNLVLQDYTEKQITDLIRYCDVAEYRSDTLIGSTHTTHMMSGNYRVAGPIPAYSELEFIDGRWLLKSSQYAVDTSLAVGMALNLRSQLTLNDKTEIRNPK